MFDIGPDKLLFVFLAVLVFLGPKELPVAVRTVSKWRRQLRDFQDTVRTELGSALELPRGPDDTAARPAPRSDGDEQS